MEPSDSQPRSNLIFLPRRPSAATDGTAPACAVPPAVRPHRCQGRTVVLRASRGRDLVLPGAELAALKPIATSLVHAAVLRFPSCCAERLCDSLAEIGNWPAT